MKETPSNEASKGDHNATATTGWKKVSVEFDLKRPEGKKSAKDGEPIGLVFRGIMDKPDSGCQALG